jgi:hypothetical protein
MNNQADPVSPKQRKEGGENEYIYEVNKPDSVTSNLSKLLFMEEFSDVIIVAGQVPDQQKIFAHKQILAASSEVFQKMLFGPFVEGSRKEVQIPNITPVTLKSLLKFIYTGKVHITEVSQIAPLIKAADFYSITNAKVELTKACKHFIEKA